MEEIKPENPPNPRILVVDDEPAILKLIQHILRKNGYDPVVAPSPAKARELVQKEKFDSVITDVVMPEESGYDLVKAIRSFDEAKNEKLPVLMLTKRRNREDVKKALDAGVSDYLIKPIDESLLIDKLSQAIRVSRGEPKTYQLNLNNTPTAANLTIEAKVTSVSETGMSIETPFKVSSRYKLSLDSAIFEEIGIKRPYMNLVSCEDKLLEDDTPAFESRFTFVGMNEAELKRVRSWLQREAIRRRK
jgi:DNA-binding response OmpR family regulator